ncbi:unnamed protein product [Durusdinium trenchii]|uniref:Uncharacterized protein n=1 Tax=Durusdinium trenchii TaxID=1381693 RepID=A0ABP0M7D0_9DINO
MAFMLQALLILGVVDLLGALRTVDEVESRVPAVILTELRSANAEVSDHVKMLEDANAAAEQKKEASKKKIDEKVKVMQELQKKTHALEAKASKSRELMLRVEKAQTEHTEKGQEHAKSIEKFKDLSDEMESVARKVLLKEQALRQIVKTLKRQIAALRAELDALRTTREAAEVEMQTLKSQALSAGQLKEGAEQEQAKVEEAMQTAKKELQAMQAQLNVAVSAATVAEAQEEEATNRAREAARKRDDARQTQALLKKLRQKVKLYYESVEEVEMASPAKDLKQLPETKVLLENFNHMVAAFWELRSFDQEVYQKVKGAMQEIDRNSLEQVKYVCNPRNKLTAEEEQKCVDGLWESAHLRALAFPKSA